MKKILASFLALFAGAALAATTVPPSLIKPTGSVAGQAIVSTGPTTSPAWGAVTAGALAPIAANTVLGNFTASSTAPAAFAVPSCSTSNSALKYTSGAGLSCGTNFSLTSGDLSQFASTTSAQLAGVISNETGSGTLVFGTSPTLTTPVIASITNGGALTLPTGPDTLVGRATTDTLINKTLTSPTVNTATISGGTINNASVGATTASTGRFTTVVATSTITPSSTAGIVGTTTNDGANAGSFGEYRTVSAGSTAISSGVITNITSDSLTAGDWDVSCTVAYVPAGSTTTSQVNAGISTTSAAFGGVGASYTGNYASPAGTGNTINTPMVRISIASTTTVFCVGLTTFAVSTMQTQGFMRSRRVR